MSLILSMWPIHGYELVDMPEQGFVCQLTNFTDVFEFIVNVKKVF
jgi:hypothetical protein